MDIDKIARILYSMSLDMDYADSVEYAETEIEEISKELKFLKDNDCDVILQALDVIAMENEDMEFLYKII